MSAVPRPARNARPRPSFTRLSAFTLPELLAVVTIVALLAAMLVPTLSGAQRTARACRCRANLHQIDLAVILYAQDTSCYPLYSSMDAQTPRDWVDAVGILLPSPSSQSQPGAAGPAILQCPGSCQAISSVRFGTINYGYLDDGYAFQGIGSKLQYTDGKWRSCAVREAEVLDPAGTLCVGDGITRLKGGLLLSGGNVLQRCRAVDPGELARQFGFPFQDLVGADRSIRRLHSNRANMGYCDGHVEADPLRLLFQEETESALSRWNRDHQPHREWLIP